MLIREPHFDLSGESSRATLSTKQGLLLIFVRGKALCVDVCIRGPAYVTGQRHRPQGPSNIKSRQKSRKEIEILLNNFAKKNSFALLVRVFFQILVCADAIDLVQKSSKSELSS